MNLKVDSNAFTTLTGMVGISSVNIENYNNELKDKCLMGNIRIFGNYYGNKIEDDQNLQSFENIIPYEIVFTQDNIQVNNLEIENFEYYEVAGRGIESSFIISVDYDFYDVREKENLDALKEEITSEIDEVLQEKLEVVEDNFLEVTLDQDRNDQQEIITNDIEILPKSKINKEETKYQIKVIYYKDDEVVKDLCQKHNLEYDYVLKENQKYAFNENHRIIISEQNGHH